MCPHKQTSHIEEHAYGEHLNNEDEVYWTKQRAPDGPGWATHMEVGVVVLVVSFVTGLICL